MNVPTKPPLEVINESNVESVNDSFRFHIMNSKDNNKMSKLNSSNQMPLANQESKSKKQLPTIKQETKSYSNSKNSEQGASSSRKYDVTLVKKEQNREDINEQWTKLFITNIIPESKLLSDNEDEVIYNGFLDKVTLTAGKIPKYVTVNKFSIVTKRQMKFYKSKEAYLTSQRPTMILNTESILFVRRIMLNSEIKAKAFFYMKLKETNASTNSISIRESTEKENDIEKIINETTKRDSIFSKFPRNSPNKSKRNTKRISLLNDSNISDMVESARERVSQSIMEQYDLMSKEILIFSTSDEELANNWVCVLDYLLNAKEY